MTNEKKEQQQAEPAFKIRRIKFADQEGHEELEQHDESVHPIDYQCFQDLVQELSPELIDRLKEAVRPKESDNPDELESWEAEQIKNRRVRKQYESDYSFVIRALYEEIFSVNQFPTEPFKESRGYTTGGLLTHHKLRSTISGFSLKEAAELLNSDDDFSSITTRTFQKDQQNQIDFWDGEKLLTYLYDISFIGSASVISTSTEMMRSRVRGYVNAMVRTRGEITPPDDIESIGLRFLKLLKLYPQLSEPIPDDLADLLGVKNN